MRLVWIWKSLVRILIFALGLYYLLYIITPLIEEYIDNYTIVKSSTPTQIVDKVSKNYLFGKPSYNVIVDKNQHTEFVNRVSNWTFFQSQIGDNIKGFTTTNNQFYTLRDLFLHAGPMIAILFLFIMLLIGLCIWFILPIIRKRKPSDQTKSVKRQKIKRRKAAKYKKYKKTEQKNNAMWLKKILPKKFHGKIDQYHNFLFLLPYILLGMIIVYGFSMNLFLKVMPIGKEKVDAKIVATYPDWSFEYSSHKPLYIFEDTYYVAEVQFEDKKGDMFKVSKQITEVTYEKYKNHELLPISYVKWNPYHIFIRDYSVAQLFELVLYAEFLIKGLVFTLTIILLFILLRRET